MGETGYNVLMLYSQIKSDSLVAQKAGDAKLLGVLRLVLSELSYAQVDHREGDLPDEEVIKVLFREAKKRKEAIEIYEKAGDQGRAFQEKYELEIIGKYLPEMMGESEVMVEIDKVAEETGLRGGRLMGAVMGRLKGKADGALINRLVMQKYA